MFSAPRIGLGLLLLAYAVVLFIAIGAVAGGSDNSGYFNEARLFSHGRIHATERVLTTLPAADTPLWLYVPLGFRPTVAGSTQMVPTYPPGLPLLLVPAAWIAGWPHAGDMLLLLHSLAGIALTFAFARYCGLPPSWSLVAAAILAASPLYLFLSLQALSDVPATVWAAAAVVAALRSREHDRWALAAGLCLSVGLLVRPTNVLVGIPVLIAVGLSHRRLLLLALGSFPGIAAALAINHAAYGSALTSGYGAIGVEFHRDLVAGTFAFYAKWLPLLLSPVILLAPATVLLLRVSPRAAAVLLSWLLLFVGFYSAYRWTHENWWFLRFLLPAAPALIVGGLVVAQRCLQGVESRGGRALLLCPLLVAVVAVTVEATRTKQLREAWTIGHGERKYGRVAAWLNQHVPPNSAVISFQTSGALYYFTDFVLLRFDELMPDKSGRILGAARGEGRGGYAVLFPFEVDVIHHLPGKWVHLVSIDDVGIWRCDAPPAG
jgi:4-amino-4-deoxy-L-arabinose transferase-like glycosyltransferase